MSFSVSLVVEAADTSIGCNDPLELSSITATTGLAYTIFVERYTHAAISAKLSRRIRLLQPT